MASFSLSASLTSFLSRPPKTSAIFPNNFTPSHVSSFSSSALFPKLHYSSNKKSPQYWSSPIRASASAASTPRKAKVTVKVVNADQESTAEVYGTITCRSGIESDVVLFDKKRNEYIELKPGDNIPLTTPEVNVPANASILEITVYLVDYDLVSPDDEFAKDTAKFLVKDPDQSDTISISGKYGSVEVTVDWG